LTYALISTVDHFYFNINRVYMAPMMVAPMVIIMCLVMADMFQTRLLTTFSVRFVGLFILSRSLARSHADARRRRAAPAFHDSASLKRDTDVRGACDYRPGNQQTLQADHKVAERGDCADESDSRALSISGLAECRRTGQAVPLSPTR
jgi:hypothetical protein